MQARLLVIIVGILSATSCGSQAPQTPEQEAADFLRKGVACINDNRDEAIAFYLVDGTDAINQYEEMCGLDEDMLSPEAQVVLEATGESILTEMLPVVLAASMQEAFGEQASDDDDNEEETAGRVIDAIATAVTNAADGLDQVE